MKKLSAKMLLVILPVITLAMGMLMLVSISTGRRIIRSQIQENMDVTLELQENRINGALDEIMALATSISHSVASMYQHSDMDNFEAMLEREIRENDMVLGSGIWFEPYVFEASEKYMGPYVYKDSDSITTTYDYSNAEYDYFSQEYYLNAKNSDRAVITDPYYDETSGLIMSSCSVAMMDRGAYIGCITVDMELSSIQKMVEEVRVGENGFAMMLGRNGAYMGGASEEKRQNGVLITEDENTSLAAAGETILSAQSGEITYQADGESYQVYYLTLQDTAWKLLLCVPESEINRPVNQLTNQLFVICMIGLAAAALIIVVLVRGVTRNIRSVEHFAETLAAGDFTVDELTTRSKDEIGIMSGALNQMYLSNRAVIQNIAGHAGEIESASNGLSESTNKLLEQFRQIEEYMRQVNEAMMSSSAATEEVNASTEEAESSINILTGETEKSMTMVQEIRERAESVEQSSRASYDKATTLSTRFETQLGNSIEKASVVADIGQMAQVISEIAEQINLLALNASIEAARAGEQGRGFTVVATEIGKLANETSEAVGGIQETIDQVQEAFRNLSENASELLDFLKHTVAPDYDSFVGVAQQYGDDAERIAKTSEAVSSMSDNIRRIMEEVTKAIQNIAESSQQTADVSAGILKSVDEVSGVVGEVAEMSSDQQQIAEKLTEMVSRFKLS